MTSALPSSVKMQNASPLESGDISAEERISTEITVHYLDSTNLVRTITQSRPDRVIYSRENAVSKKTNNDHRS